jgi:murein DD-endopeptidase MepM/ murein hydrolase activator NlpD
MTFWRDLFVNSVYFICLFCSFTVQPCSSQDVEDSLNTGLENDSATISETQENEFQQDLNTLFDYETTPEDTFAWDTKKINSGRFDPKEWLDTAHIIINDSSLGKFYVHPFKNIITSNFGSRRNLWHYGIDIRLAKGDTVRCAFDGIVRVRQYDRRGYGVVIVVRHPNGLETLYGHLSKTDLIPTSRVKAGDVIGFGGNTGRSTGSHLHFEMRYFGQPFDPNLIIDFKKYSIRDNTLILTKANFDYLIQIAKTKWHTIRRGETLGHIAIRHHTSVKTLCRLNKLTYKTKLRPGKRIIIYSAKRSDRKLSLRIKPQQPKS